MSLNRLGPIVVLGASRHYRASIRSLRKLGAKVVCFDRNPKSEGFADADAGYIIDISDAEAVSGKCKELKATAVIPVNDVGVVTAALVSDELGLPGLSVDVASRSTNKALMRRIWLESGVPCPKVREIYSREDLTGAIQDVGLPVILKPASTVGGASRGVVVVSNLDDVDTAADFAFRFAPNNHVLVEQFIEADSEHSVEILIRHGKAQVLAVGDKLKSALPYRVDKAITYPSSVAKDTLEVIKSVAVNAARTIGIDNGAAHVELAMVAGSPVLFELGARPGGGATAGIILPYLTGIDYFLEYARALSDLDGPQTELHFEHKNSACVYLFLTPDPGVVSSICPPATLSGNHDVLDWEVFLEAGSEINPVRTGLDRAGFIVAVGESPHAALSRALELEKDFQIVYESESTSN